GIDSNSEGSSFSRILSALRSISVGSGAGGWTSDTPIIVQEALGSTTIMASRPNLRVRDIG
ncbi:MAG: hypothetical protein VYD37_06285, partial [Gemmatimonadota bacterium]|nr:hypothetical protein [Gemmatimonadota bacterium]